MRRVAFHPEADAEITEAARYYEDRGEGLGFSFLLELDASLEQIAANPEAFPLVSHEIRRKPLKRFPYGLLYIIAPDQIRIIAVAKPPRPSLTVNENSSLPT